MTDIFSKHRTGATPSPPLARSASSETGSDCEHLMPLVEMLYFAYRDFTGEADAALEIYGLGRAHHRVLHFVNRHPGIRVADLLDLLRITKQSLGRVLRKLIADGWIEQSPGAADRRERRLTLTARGRELALHLARLQTRRIAAALHEIEARGSPDVRQHVTDFLLAMVAHEARDRVADLVASTPPIPLREPRP